MSLKDLLKPFPWSLYGKKLQQKILNPRSHGYFSQEDAKERGMRLVVASAGEVEEGNKISFYFLVDPEDGVIVDCRFQLFGQSALIGAAEITCGLLVGKNYVQAQRISADLIDKEVRERAELSAFPEETDSHLNLILDAIDHGVEQCSDIPVEASYASPPLPDTDSLEHGEEYPGWIELPLKEKISLIEDVIDRDIRPYVEMDGGGLEVINFIDNYKVIITYSGACNGCFAATGSTLTAIQECLRTRLHPSIVVEPDLEIK